MATAASRGFFLSFGICSARSRIFASNFQNVLRGALCIALMVVLPSCSRPARSGDKQFYDAVEYNDFVVDQQNSILRRIIRLNELYDTAGEQRIRLQFDSLVAETDASMQHLRELTPYEGDSSVKQEALKLMQFYHRIFRNEYRRILEIFLKGELATDAEVEEMGRIVEQLGNDEMELHQSLAKAQENFARKHRFEFEPMVQSR